jgi:hypothetical protein
LQVKSKAKEIAMVIKDLQYLTNNKTEMITKEVNFIYDWYSI